jgi:transposase-like protein
MYLNISYHFHANVKIILISIYSAEKQLKKEIKKRKDLHALKRIHTVVHLSVL